MEIVPQLVLNSIIAGAIYAMVALGFNLIFSTVKFFDLGYGGLAVVGAYTAFFALKKLSWGILPAAAAALLLAGLLGFLLYRLVYAPLRARRASSLVMLVASLGVFTMIQALAAIFFTSQFQTLSPPAGGAGRVYEVFGGTITQVQTAILAIGLGLMVVLALVIQKTKFGKMVRATSDDEEVAKIIGINTGRVIGAVFFIGSAIAGLAGVLVGLDTGIEPTMGLPLLLKGVIAAIVGGVGNIYGGVLGAFLLGFVENFGIWFISGEWKEAIAFGLLIVFLLFRPQGIIKK